MSLSYAMHELRSEQRDDRARRLLAVLAFVGIGGTVLGKLAWNYAIQQLGATRAAAYTYLQPVVGVAIAWVAPGEGLAPLQILGRAAVLLGLVLYGRSAPANSAGGR